MMESREDEIEGAGNSSAKSLQSEDPQERKLCKES